MQILISAFARRIRAPVPAIAVLSIAFLAALLPIAPFAHGDTEVKKIAPRVATADELEKIVALIFAELKILGVPPPPPAPGEPPEKRRSYPVVLVNETTAFCGESQPGKDACPEHGEFGSDLVLTAKSGLEVPSQLVSELYAANRSPRTFDCVASAWVQCTTPAEIAGIFSDGRWWDDFYGRFPRTSGYSKISNVVISRDGHFALLYLSHSCGGLCGGGRFVLLKRAGTTWVIEQQIHTWVS